VNVNFVAAKKVSWAGLLVFPAIGALILFFCEPTTVPIYPVCVFHRVTGLDCPACGSLRAMHQLLHGNFAAALQFNAFLIVSLPLIGWAGFRWMMRQRRGERGIGIRPLWYWFYLAAFVAFGIVRNVPPVAKVLAHAL
jgi:hypothetical protein